MKNVLILAFHYPPSSASGTHRIAGFTRYLREFGWEPIILTVNPEYYQSNDNGLLERIPEGIKTYRTPMIARKYSPKPTTGTDTISHTTPVKTNILKKVVYPPIKSIYRLLSFPDEFIGWTPYALSEVKKILSENKIDLLFATGGPFSTLRIALQIKRQYGLPWVADFRDPWASSSYWPYPKYFRPFCKTLEKKILHTSDKITLVTEGLREIFLHNYPDIDPDKFVTITNGYDPDLFDNIIPIPDSRFTLTHSGWFYGQRKPDYLVKAFQYLLNNYPDVDKNSILLRLIGPIPKELPDLIHSSGLDENVELVGMVSHHKNLGYLKSSHVLIVVGGSEDAKDLFIPAKIFEYMAAKRTILALVNPGDTSNLIIKGNLGKVAPPTHIEEIAAAIHQMYLDYKLNSNSTTPANTLVDQFNRRLLTQKLSSLFESALK